MDNQDDICEGDEPEAGKKPSVAPMSMDSDFGELPVADEPNSEVLALKQDLESEREKYIRLYADFDNYKKRTSKEKADIYAYASQPLMEKLLTVLDSFESALKEEQEFSLEDPVYKGLVMVSNNLKDMLKAEGLKQIASVGEKFDPNLHNGVATDDKDDMPDEQITEEFIRGYIYKDRVLRPAVVKVNRKS